QFLSSIVNDVGGDVAAVSADVTAQDALVEDYDAMRTSISGVDTDEEAVRLIEYQAAYRAAAKIVSATDEMLRVLTTLGA
ncbi:MAG TPA: flagellar basal body rod C-terminal domain-containing protein, partial [Myxococcota bacterium]|nr:flagellar basal body rod C-terminal domain-containing protein [Myxococcota bacterium]